MSEQMTVSQIKAELSNLKNGLAELKALLKANEKNCAVVEKFLKDLRAFHTWGAEEGLREGGSHTVGYNK